MNELKNMNIEEARGTYEKFLRLFPTAVRKIRLTCSKE
jgi:hypothetical protein